MTDRLALDAVVRGELGTSASKRIRKDSMIPAVIYGGKDDNVFVSLPKKEMDKLYLSHNLYTTIIDLNVDGKIYNVLPYQIDLHPISDLPRHIDLIRVQEGKPTKVRVRLLFSGIEKSPGMKKGGYLNIIHRRLELLCDSEKIPHSITVNVSKLKMGDKIRVSAIRLPEGAKPAYKKDEIVATVTGRGGKQEEEDFAPVAPVGEEKKEEKADEKQNGEEKKEEKKNEKKEGNRGK